MQKENDTFTHYFIGKPKPEKMEFQQRIFICKLNLYSCTKACEMGFLRIDPFWPTQKWKIRTSYRKIFNKPQECFSQDTNWTLSFTRNRLLIWLNCVTPRFATIVRGRLRKDKKSPRQQYISIWEQSLFINWPDYKNNHGRYLKGREKNPLNTLITKN